MNQGELFSEPRPKAQRHSETSCDAATAIRGHAAKQRAMVLDWLRRSGAEGMTDQELEHATWLAGNSVRPRRVELVESGHVRDSGKRRKTTSGREAVVWVAAEYAAGD